MNDSLNLLVLGNGFDIEAGLKSKFEQFMDDYIGCAVMENYSKQLNDFNFITNYSCSGNVVSIVNNFKEQCFDAVKLKNVIVTILLQKKCTGDVTWSDVEQNLKDFLTSFEDDYIHDKGLFSHQWLTFIIDRSEASKSFPFSKFPRNDEEFFEMCFFSQFFEYSLEHTKVLLDGKETLQSEIYRFISREVHSFEQAFGAYISDQVMGSETYLQNSKKLLNTINSEDNVVNLLDFNYTGLILKEKVSFPFNKVSNVHGTIDEKNIVIGIDGYKVDVKSSNYQFTKTFRQFSLHEGHHTNSILNPIVKTIIFFGHSLGEQDYSYFQAIFDHYQLYNSQIQLRFLYKVYCPSKADKIKNDFYNRVVRLIQEYANTLNNDGHRRNLLHKLFLEERVQIQDIDNFNW